MEIILWDLEKDFYVMIESKNCTKMGTQTQRANSTGVRLGATVWD